MSNSDNDEENRPLHPRFNNKQHDAPQAQDEKSSEDHPSREDPPASPEDPPASPVDPPASPVYPPASTEVEMESSLDASTGDGIPSPLRLAE